MNVDVCDRRLNFICEKGLFIKENLFLNQNFLSVVDRCSSLNDICGKHGHCVNTDDGQFRCECHFLFSGNRCRSSQRINFKLINLSFYLNFLVSREGSQVIIAAIFIVTACITPILIRSIYRMLKKKLDRSSPIYGKLHCLNNRLEQEYNI
jgi:hypothetical protein